MTRVPGTRDQYRIEKKDDYILADGVHEAIVSEEIWDEAHRKRQTRKNIQLGTRAYFIGYFEMSYLWSSYVRWRKS